MDTRAPGPYPVTLLTEVVMRRSTVRRSLLATLMSGVGMAIALLVPGTAHAAEYYELGHQTIGPDYCPGANQSLTVWKKGVQENQVWSQTDTGGLGYDSSCKLGTTLTQVLYLVNDAGAVAQSYGTTSATVTNNGITTIAAKKVSYTLPIGWSFHLHSYTCYQGACSKLHVAAVQRIGPGTGSEDWNVVTVVA